MRRYILAVASAVLMMGGWGLAYAPQAIAAGCDGAGCNGKDPIAMGCASDAYTPSGAYINTPEGHTELRYSPSCHANWARITNSSPGSWFYVQNYNGDSQQYYVPSGYNNAYTDMVNGYPLARAGDHYNHTGWY